MPTIKNAEYKGGEMKLVGLYLNDGTFIDLNGKNAKLDIKMFLLIHCVNDLDD